MPEYLKSEMINNESIFLPGTVDDYTHILFEKQEYLDKAESLLRQVEVEKEHNRNLIRIARERANRKSGADKSSSGYWILKWRPTKYSDRTSKGITYNELKLYSITFQTPLDCSLPLNIVDQNVQTALEDGLIVLNEERNYMWYEDLYNTVKKCAFELRDTSDKIIIERRYMSNVKQGFWEVELITNFEPRVTEKNRQQYV